MNAALAFLAESAGEAAGMKAELLSGFVDGLTRSGLTYCLLSGFESYPDASDGDLDFMIRPSDVQRLAPMVETVARSCKAQLVQAIQHETGAWHFILAKQAGHEVACFSADCTVDYRRDGRLWLRAGHVLARRRWCGCFYVAAKAYEFLYYLIKKVLKQEVNCAHLRRLRVLYAACPEECCEGMCRFWPVESVGRMTSAILRSDEPAMQSLMHPLLVELRASRQVEGWGSRMGQKTRELQRRWRRVTNPTGLGVVVWGGNEPERMQLAAALEEKLRPAFRRTSLMDDARTGGWGAEWLARVRSTLVIRTAHSRPKRFPVTNLNLCALDAGAHNVASATRLLLEQMTMRIQRRPLPGR